MIRCLLSAMHGVRQALQRGVERGGLAAHRVRAADSDGERVDPGGLYELDRLSRVGPYACGMGALRLRRLAADVAELGLDPVVKTSGGTGLHVILRLAPKYDYDAVKAFAELVARHVAERNPSKVTLERMIKKRKRGTVYIDWVQVGKGKTIVPPFVVRARPGAPVSMPLEWKAVDEMSRKAVRDPLREFARWSMRNVPALLKKSGDPWAAGGKRHSLETALRKATKAWA